MKKVLLLGLTALFTTTASLGQEKGAALGIDVEVKEYKTGRATTNFGSIDGKQYAQGKSGFVLYFFPIAMHTLLNKKENGQVLKSVKLEDKNQYFKRKKFEVTKFFTIGENIVEIVPRYDENASRYTIYAEAFNQSLKSVELGEIYATKFREDTRFGLSYDQYDEKLLIKISKYQNKELVSITCLLVDQDLETEEIIEVNTEEDGTFTGSTSHISSDKEDFRYAISTNQKDDELGGICYQIDLKNGRDTDLELDFSELEEKKSHISSRVRNNKLYVFGFSKVEKGKQILDEYFTQIYDLETKKRIAYSTHELDPEFIIENEIDAYKKTYQKAIDNEEYKSARTLNIVQTRFLDNGNILHIATNYGYNTMQQIFVFLLNENGELIKKTSFPLRQYAGQAAFGIKSYRDGSELKLCYMDREGLRARTIDLKTLESETAPLLAYKKFSGYNYTSIYTKENEIIVQGVKLSKEQSIHITF